MRAITGSSCLSRMDSWSSPDRATSSSAPHVVSTDRASWRTRPAPDVRARLPFFCVDLLEHVDLEQAIGEQLLELPVLALEYLEPPRVVGRHRAEPLTPHVDRLVADAVLLRRASDVVRAVGLAQDLNHLLVAVLALLHRSLRSWWRESTFYVSVVQFSAGRSTTRSLSSSATSSLR